MNQETVDALDQFFSAQKKLNELGIIRSRDYIGDVARYLCREVYNLETSKGRRTGYDGSEFSPIRGNSVGEWTFKRNKGYLHFPCWPGTETTICQVNGNVKSAKLLGSPDKLTVDHDRKTGGITIRGLPRKPPHQDVSIHKVTFDRKPKRKKVRDRASWLQV